MDGTAVFLGIKLHQNLQIEITKARVIVVHEPKHVIKEDGVTVQKNEIITWFFSAMIFPGNSAHTGVLHEGLKQSTVQNLRLHLEDLLLFSHHNGHCISSSSSVPSSGWRRRRRREAYLLVPRRPFSPSSQDFQKTGFVHSGNICKQCFSSRE